MMPQNHSSKRRWIGLFLAFVLAGIGYVVLKSPRPTVNQLQARLGLPRFFVGQHVASADVKEVEALSEPEMGWRTNGQPVPSPTRVATLGLQAALARDVATARRCADWLLQHGHEPDGTLSFPFRFDFVPYWPFELRAPWSSAITQGLALGLFTQLYLVEQRPDDLAAARKIAAFYHRPLELGGFTRFEPDGPFFEEYPTVVPTRVLNGALFAMLALNDYALVSQDESAADLFRRAVTRLAALLPEYEVLSLEAGCPLSAYSLAPIRPRLLMRLVGDGKTLVRAIRFVGVRGGAPATLAEVRIGEADDDYPMNPLYVWVDPRAMNWGSPVKQMFNSVPVQGRVAGAQVGSFNHSPFVLGWLPEFAEVEKPAVEVDFVPLQGAPLQATLFDGTEFWPLGMLDGPPGEFTTARFDFPAEYPLTMNTTPDPRTRIDDRYLDDNQRLLKYLGKVADNNQLLQWVEHWQNSYIAVPRDWLYLADTLFLEKKSPEPLPLEQPDCTMIGQPAVLRVGEMLHLFYLAAAPDQRRRLYLATSSDGQQWTRQGQVLADDVLPYPGDIAHVSIAPLGDRQDAARFLMAFTVSDTPGSARNRLCLADSLNAGTWTIRRTLPLGDLAACALISDARGGCELYYIPPPAGLQAQVMVMSSDDGVAWSPSTLCIADLPLLDSSRLPSLSVFHLDDAKGMLIERASRTNHHLALYLQQPDSAWYAFAENPVYACDDRNPRWDAARSDWCIVPDDDGLDVYYTARSGRKADKTSPATISRARLDVARLRQYLTDESALPQRRTKR